MLPPTLGTTASPAHPPPASELYGSKAGLSGAEGALHSAATFLAFTPEQTQPTRVVRKIPSAPADGPVLQRLLSTGEHPSGSRTSITHFMLTLLEPQLWNVDKRLHCRQTQEHPLPCGLAGRRGTLDPESDYCDTGGRCHQSRGAYPVTHVGK